MNLKLRQNENFSEWNNSQYAFDFREYQEYQDLEDINLTGEYEVFINDNLIKSYTDDSKSNTENLYRTFSISNPLRNDRNTDLILSSLPERENEILNISANRSPAITRVQYTMAAQNSIQRTVRPASSPIAIGDEVQVLSNRANIILASNLLTNDIDPGNNRFSLLGVSNPVRGKVEINNYGNIIFTPDPNYTGVAEFSYTIRNTLGLRATTKVTVKVNKLPTMPIGTNIASINDWSPQIPLIDLFKLSRAWFWEGPYTTITTNIDSNGWLTSLTPPNGIPRNAKPATVIFPGMPNRYLGGRYVVLYDGEGTINYRWAATKNMTLSRPGRDVIDINSSNSSGIVLQMISTDPNRTGNYIRNIRIIPEALEGTYMNNYDRGNFNPVSANIFNPNWMNKIAPFSTLRFMDWMRTNGSQQVNWSDRPTLEQARWTMLNGAPLEVMVALANQGNFNPWFNMPHMATDDYVRNFALYVKNNLETDKKVYVEYTNEGWNTFFPQTTWINERAKETGLTGTQWFARRTAEMINIWKDVFSDQSERIVGVLATQAANSSLGSAAIDYLKSTGNFSAIDAIAIAPYFGHYLGSPTFSRQVRGLNVNSIFQELTQGGVIKRANGTPAVPGGALQRSYSWMESYAELARKNNLELLAYEAGQHIVGYGGVQNNATINNLFIAVNRDPRMGQLYQEYMAKWHQLGGGLLAHFNDVRRPSKFGSWGMMEHLNDINNPKYTSIIQMSQR